MTKNDVNLIASKIIDQNPDIIINYLLSTKILNKKINVNSIKRSVWYSLLKSEQHSNGSWGRFHSQNRNVKAIFKTTEAAIHKCIAIGIDKSDIILRKSIQYMEKILENNIEWDDSAEKNDRWVTGVEMITAATLSLIDPQNSILDSIFEKWLNIAKIAFKSGQYKYINDKMAHKEINNISSELNYLTLNNKYALMILGARSKEISKDLEYMIVNWIWNNKNGIGYFKDLQLSSFCNVTNKLLVNTWLPSLELLSRFDASKKVCKKFIDFLIAKNENGYWDFGKQQFQIMDFPLSENWRKRNNRKFDYSTKILLLLNDLLN